MEISMVLLKNVAVKIQKNYAGIFVSYLVIDVLDAMSRK